MVTINQQQAAPHNPHSAFNQQASPNIPQPAIYSHFTDQARRAGYMGPELGRTRLSAGYVGPELRRTRQHFHPYPHPHSFPLSHPHSHSLSHLLSLPNRHPRPRSFLPPHSHEMHETIQRETEKQRIKEEIIMSEIVRRRDLEAEVRREIRMERELALQRGGNEIPFGSSSVIGFESPTRLPLLGTAAEGRSMEERIILSLAEKERLNGRRGNGGFETSPSVRRSADLRISEVKSVSEAGKEKGKIILLAKPDEDISGSKRKAVTSPAGPDSSEPPSGGGILIRKKIKEEWSCAVCQVSATSEHALSEHLNGKKHKSKEAALRAQRAGKNYSIGLFPKKATEVPGTGDSGPSESPPLLMGNLNSDISKNHQSLVVPLQNRNLEKNESVLQQKDGSERNKYKLWCELCQVWSHSGKVMNNHKRGKKHARRLEASERKATLMVENREGVDEDGKNVDKEEGGPEDHETDSAADEA